MFDEYDKTKYKYKVNCIIVSNTLNVAATRILYSGRRASVIATWRRVRELKNSVWPGAISSSILLRQTKSSSLVPNQSSQCRPHQHQTKNTFGHSDHDHHQQKDTFMVFISTWHSSSHRKRSWKVSPLKYQNCYEGITPCLLVDDIKLFIRCRMETYSEL